MKDKKGSRSLGNTIKKMSQDGITCQISISPKMQIVRERIELEVKVAATCFLGSPEVKSIGGV